MMTTHLHLAPKLGMSRATPQIPLDDFMARMETAYVTMKYVYVEFRRLDLKSAAENYYVLSLLCDCHIALSGL